MLRHTGDTDYANTPIRPLPDATHVMDGDIRTASRTMPVLAGRDTPGKPRHTGSPDMAPQPVLNG